jgi:hypothetical protein
MSKVDISGYIVPWSLPNERMPLHVTWSPDVFFDKIHVIVPSDFRIHDILNVDEVELKEHEAIITKVKSPCEGFPCYFGMVISAFKIFEELKVAKKITVNFIRNGETYYCLELYGRIFRPRLEILKSPKEIELTDDMSKNKLPLNLRYIGFGDIELKIEATIGGKIVSIGESIVYELMRRLWLSDIVEKKMEKSKTIGSKEKDKQKRELRLEPAYVRQMAQKLQEMIDRGIIPTEELDAEAIAGLKEWLADVKTKDKFMEIVYEKTGELLLSLLMDLFEKNPTSNVKLQDAKTIIRTKIKTPVTALTLRLLYKDNIGNDYPPIEIPIQVSDKRTESSGFLIEIPILIEKWESEPFMNVEKMEILEGK